MSIRLTFLSWTFKRSASTPVLFASINTQVANNMHRSSPFYRPSINVCFYFYSSCVQTWLIKVARELHAPVKFNPWYRGKSCLGGYCKICTVWTWEFPVHESTALFDTGNEGNRRFMMVRGHRGKHLRTDPRLVWLLSVSQSVGLCHLHTHTLTDTLIQTSGNTIHHQK